MTDMERLDAYEHANEFLVEDSDMNNLTNIERALCHSVIDMNRHIVDLQSRLDAANQTIAELQTEVDVYKTSAQQWIDEVALWEEENQIFRETLSTISQLGTVNGEQQFDSYFHRQSVMLARRCLNRLSGRTVMRSE